MADKIGNIIMGQAELLPEREQGADGLPGAPGGPSPWTVPGFDPEGPRKVLRDDLLEVQARIQALPAEACPGGLAMVEIVLCPSCLRQGSFPDGLFGELGLTQLGSRLLKKVPRSAGGQGGPRDFLSVYGAIGKASLGDVGALVGGLGDRALGQALALETIRIEDPADKFMPDVDLDLRHYEVVLELVPGRGDLFPLAQFRSFAADRCFRVVEEYRVESCGLSFLPVKGPGPCLARLAEFTFVRQVGEIPRMRSFKPLRPRTAQGPGAAASQPAPAPGPGGEGRAGTTGTAKEDAGDGRPAATGPPGGGPGAAGPQAPGEGQAPPPGPPEAAPASGGGPGGAALAGGPPPTPGEDTGDGQAPLRLPQAAPDLPDLGVLIMDAGLPDSHPIGPWLKGYSLADPEAGDVRGGPEHGLAVASAFLFGPLPEGQGDVPQPPSRITAVRLLDSSSNSPAEGDDELTMLRVLGRMREVLRAHKPRYANLSFGPNLSMSDGRIHAWTATLDELAFEHGLFLTVAAGNNGDGKKPRLQIPADAINCLGVGATDSLGPGWRRAGYSALGPGRSPNVVKPDLVAFGGGDAHPFMVLDADNRGQEIQDEGTSFAAPFLLRQAVGLGALAGPGLSRLSAKALLVHTADRGGHGPEEVGWGLALPAGEILSPPAGVRRLLFQGHLPPGRAVLLRLPAPEGPAGGRARLKATLCYRSRISVHDPASYSQTPVRADFLPDLGKAAAGAWPGGRPAPFFDLDGGEADPRADPRQVMMANVRSNERTFVLADLPAPGFVVRQVVLPARPPVPVEYSLVASLIPVGA
jgi:hypothetical protein